MTNVKETTQDLIEQTYQTTSPSQLYESTLQRVTSYDSKFSAKKRKKVLKVKGKPLNKNIRIGHNQSQIQLEISPPSLKKDVKNDSIYG